MPLSFVYARQLVTKPAIDFVGFALVFATISSTLSQPIKLNLRPLFLESSSNIEGTNPSYLSFFRNDRTGRSFLTYTSMVSAESIKLCSLRVNARFLNDDV